ncbi:TPA: hypothetical protein ACTZ3A_001387 [Bacillus cereus]|uniref:hypothetical protein n=1 Tax=Bacillus cereus group sp. BfR-BA-01363 TaxID=3094882 RepID=UPI0029C2B1C5|nr:hypothetical protein [Bacillus cereus group sp. BfR-BA-01363]MDX5853614.1 hypothetical protein [Bacillus cereus group sp. BfR-BA-01363]
MLTLIHKMIENPHLFVVGTLSIALLLSLLPTSKGNYRGTIRFPPPTKEMQDEFDMFLAINKETSPSKNN